MSLCYQCFHEYEGFICPYCGYDAQASRGKYPFALPCGAVVGGKYLIGKILGQGGFGITYIAQDYKDKHLVAIKEFYPDSLAGRSGVTVVPFTGEREEAFLYGKECFLEEAKTLAQFIGDPNIVQVFNYFEENNTTYFAMEYLEGESLMDYLKRRGGRIPYDEAKRFFFPVMDALSMVHATGIIHRDISPDNIFITKDGAVKLIDLGAARYSLGNRSCSLDIVLKHGYAPKEQYVRRGRQGPFTDVYALAASIYYAITGELPPDSIDRMEEDTLIDPSSLGCDIPSGAKSALIKALSVRAEDRYQSMMEFKEALIGGESVTFVTPVQYTNPQTVTIRDFSTISSDMSPLLKRAYLFLEDGDWNSADTYAERVLDQDPENGEAYLVKLMAQLQVHQWNELVSLPKPFDDSNNYKKVIRFGRAALVSELERYNVWIREQNKAAQLDTVYNRGVNLMNFATNAMGFTVAANVFKSISGWRDAQALSEECFNQAENARKEAIYRGAVKLQEQGYYDEAIKKFSSVFFYKDARPRIDFCKRKIHEYRQQEEYYIAVKQMDYNSVAVLSQAKATFGKMLDFKDARYRYEVCSRRIEVLKRQKK